MNKECLIAEYERLRQREDELVEELNTVDAQLIEIEHQLPDGYAYPGDPPLNCDWLDQAITELDNDAPEEKYPCP